MIIVIGIYLFVFIWVLTRYQKEREPKGFMELRFYRIGFVIAALIWPKFAIELIMKRFSSKS